MNMKTVVFFGIGHMANFCRMLIFSVSIIPADCRQCSHIHATVFDFHMLKGLMISSHCIVPAGKDQALLELATSTCYDVWLVWSASRTIDTLWRVPLKAFQERSTTF